MISTERKLYYPLLLILSSHIRKTAESLAQTLNKSGDTVLRILKEESIDENELISKAQQYFGTTKVELIIDDSIIKKMYSKYIEGSGDNYDPVSKQTLRSLCTVVAMVSNGKIALPVVQKLWIKKELCSEGLYQTKVKIAQELIDRLIGKLEIKIVLMDGAYATTDMVNWCRKRSIPFEMRFHSNRRIALDQDNPNITVKVNQCKELKLKGRKTCRTVKALWRGELVYITSVKYFRKDNSDMIVYQISNFCMLSRKHASAYKHRWPIEMFFRTSKQHLGLADCQSRKKNLQENHLYNVFYAYAILQLAAKNAKLKNPELALKRFKRKNAMPFSFHLERVDQVFRTYEAIHA